MVVTTPNELLVSSGVAHDRGVAVFQFQDYRRASLYIGGSELKRFSWRFVEPVPLGVDPKHDWNTRKKAPNLRAFESIKLGMTETQVAEIPYFRGFPEYLTFFFIPKGTTRADAQISRCELHGHVSFCIEEDRVVAKGIPMWPEREVRVFVVDDAFATRLGLDGSERVSVQKSVVDCRGITTSECYNRVGSLGFLSDGLRIEGR